MGASPLVRTEHANGVIGELHVDDLGKVDVPLDVAALAVPGEIVAHAVHVDAAVRVDGGDAIVAN